MITLIGLPSTLPPKSSTAICAAVTEPWPVGVDAGPFMSVRTPILTASSEICARAACDANVAAANAASTDMVLAEITGVLPRCCSAHWPYSLTGSVAQPAPWFVQLFCVPRQRRQCGRRDVCFALGFNARELRILHQYNY